MIGVQYRSINDTVADAYRELLTRTLQYNQGRGYKNTSVEFDGANLVILMPEYNLIASKARKFNYRYMLAEFLWNSCATRSIDVLEKVFPGVTRFVGDQPKWSRGNVAWAYGPTMSAGLPTILQELRDDPGSRRAVITISHPLSYAKTVLGAGTPPCLVSVQWLLRKGFLYQYTTMRSNDIWRGFPLDIYQFSMWQVFLAAALGVKVGEYHHTVGSLHLYEADREAATLMAHSDMRAIKTSGVHPNAIETLLHGGGRSVLDIMRGNDLTESDDPLHVYLNTYQGSPEMEFKVLKDGGYGTW